MAILIWIGIIYLLICFAKTTAQKFFEWYDFKRRD